MPEDSVRSVGYSEIISVATYPPCRHSMESSRVPANMCFWANTNHKFLSNLIKNLRLALGGCFWAAVFSNLI